MISEVKYSGSAIKKKKKKIWLWKSEFVKVGGEIVAVVENMKCKEPGQKDLE